MNGNSKLQKTAPLDKVQEEPVYLQYVGADTVRPQAVDKVPETRL